MQYLKPILQQEASVTTISHNSLEELRREVLNAKANGETAIYVADGIYSMGGVCPVNPILEMADELDFYLYLDDAHGTTILGERGEGPVLSQINGPVPERLFVTFSMTKGFGAAGGGILVSDKNKESIIRTYGQIYAFSAPLDFASINACHKILDLHEDGTVNKLQQELYNKVAYFDELMNVKAPFSPIRMIKIGNEQTAIKIARKILDRGFFVLVAFFPVVARNNAQLRICISSKHSYEQISELSKVIQEVTAEVLAK
jgi:7-keto-8-aminopelargonate synthetase-like enzyme